MNGGTAAVPISLKELLMTLVEPWMDVLLVGLSPELLAGEQLPRNLCTVRHGGSPPSGAWDAVILRGAAGEVPRACEGASGDVRQGGLLALVALPEENPSDPQEWIRFLEAREYAGECRPCEDGAMVVLGRRQSPGRHDLVGLRRCLRRLEGHMLRLEVLAQDLSERRSGLRSHPGAPTPKELIGLLGDEDRHHYLPALKALLHPDIPRDHPPLEAIPLARRGHDRHLLAELVCRFRHFRYQSLAFLDHLDEESLLRPGPGPDGHPTCAAELTRTWLREEEALFVRLENLLRADPG